MTTPFADHFSGTSAGYARHRPSYPAPLAEWLAGLCPQKALALDCGCGSGQFSRQLASHFDAVVATDASAQQVQHAAPHPRVTYRVARAESSGLADHSADCITVAQAAHWFDLPAFYAEVQRIARPNAVVALVSYGTMQVEDAACDAIVQQLYRDTLDAYWPPERRLVESGYRTLPFPFDEVDMPAYAMTAQWTCGDVTGYIRTWSAISAARKAIGDGFLDAFETALHAAWGERTASRAIRWPLAGRVGIVRAVT